MDYKVSNFDMFNKIIYLRSFKDVKTFSSDQTLETVHLAAHTGRPPP